MLSRPRTAVSVVFFANGMSVLTWAAHIPHVRNHLELSDSVLGLVIFAIAVGAVSGMLLAAPVSARVGPHRVTRVAAIAVYAALPLPILAPNLWTLVPAAIALGASIGTTDVAMNAVAADVEHRAGRPFMSSFHGMFSLGGLVAALAASGAYRLGVAPWLEATVIAGLMVVGSWASLRDLPAATRGVGGEGSGRVRFPRGILAVIGVIAVVVFIAEGSVIDWSGVVMRENFRASPPVAVAGLVAFSIAMAGFRFAGDAINARVGPVALVRWGATLAAIGLGSAMLLGDAYPVAAIAGFAIVGVGLSNTVPVLFTAAAARGETAAEGLSSIAVLGYGAFLIGPPAIGGLADATSLPLALGLVAALCAAGALLAPAVRKDR